jgi:CRP/FNR family transcriptional regulator, cyclic AMP receptor protein
MPLGVRKNAKVEMISKVPLFAGLSKSELGQVASIADEIDLRQDKVLIREGERGREFFALLEGEAEVRRKGRKLATMRQGEFFGEIALVSSLLRTATVTATSPVRALVIRDVEFRALLQQKPQIALKVLETVASRLPPERT